MGRNRGFTLIEVMVAASVSIIVVMAVTQLTTQSQKLSKRLEYSINFTSLMTTVQMMGQTNARCTEMLADSSNRIAKAPSAGAEFPVSMKVPGVTGRLGESGPQKGYSGLAVNKIRLVDVTGQNGVYRANLLLSFKTPSSVGESTLENKSIVLLLTGKEVTGDPDKYEITSCGTVDGGSYGEIRIVTAQGAGSASCNAAEKLIACSGVASFDAGYGRRALLHVSPGGAGGGTCSCSSTDPNESGRISNNCKAVTVACLKEVATGALYTKRGTATGKVSCDGTDTALSCMGEASSGAGGGRRALWYLYPLTDATGSYCSCGSTDPNENGRAVASCDSVTALCAKSYENQTQLYRVEGQDTHELHCQSERDVMISCNSAGAPNGRSAVMFNGITRDGAITDYCYCSVGDPNENNRVWPCPKVQALCARDGGTRSANALPRNTF